MTGDEEALDQQSYQSLVGSLMYLATCTRPDIASDWAGDKASIAMARNPQFHGRAKHIDIKHHFVRE